VCAAINISAPKFRLGPARRDEAGAAIRAVADELSGRIGEPDLGAPPG
jgi:DNA-binding IclR family transcriptional regulator